MNKNTSPHGGDIYTEGLLKGKSLIDYSSNINPLGIPKGFKDNIEEILQGITRYPDYKYRNLRESIFKYHEKYEGAKITDQMIVLGNGASEILDLSIRDIKEILIVVPSFIEYEDIAKKWGNSIAFSVLNEELQYDYEDILEKLHFCDGMILGNPNNPSGNKIDKEKFKNILDYCENNHKKIIIDEAFVEFMEEESSFSSLVIQYKCLLLVRAITKFFGMPGVRFGYGISSNSQWIKSMEEKQNPWNINTFGEQAVVYSFNDEEYIKKSKKWISKEIEYFKARVEKLSFVEKAYSTNTNFILIKLKEIKEQQLYEKCLEGGYVIRRASNFRGLNNEYVRFAIKDRENNDRFMDFLESINNIH